LIYSPKLLDAFVFGKGSVADIQGSFRAGKHTLLWGESLFFGANGIAGTQAPVDVVKLISVPNSQFKETVLPVAQVSGQIQFSSTLSVAAYYQFQWTQSRLLAVGSYFSTTDLLDFGGERILTAPPLVPQGRSAAFYRGVDQWASDRGQGGVAVRFRAYETDFGFYAINWHSKSPQVYVKPSVLTPPSGSNEATALGEIAWNHRTSITKNPNALDPNTTRAAASIQLVYEPIYRQVYAGLDLSVPLGGSYTRGRSSRVQAFGVDRGGNLNIGVTATYLDRWRCALYFTDYSPCARLSDVDERYMQNDPDRRTGTPVGELGQCVGDRRRSSRAG
jgi:hypothetical protein